MSDLVMISEEAKAMGGGLNGFREAVQRHILRGLALEGFFQEVAFALVHHLAPFGRTWQSQQ